MYVFPYDIKPVKTFNNEKLFENFKTSPDGYVQVGNDNYYFPMSYNENIANKIYNFNIKKDDIWVLTFPRSGTTWTQEMTWLIANNLNYIKAKNISLSKRFPFFEFNLFAHENILSEFRLKHTDNIEYINVINSIGVPQYEELQNWSERRFIKTHMPISLLPPNLLTTGAKIIYVARNPKDVAVSYYHLYKEFKTLDFKGDFETFWNYFQDGLVAWGPYWNHINEGWKNRNSSNMLFMFYEDMNKDLVKSIKKVSDFLDVNLTKDQINELSNHLEIKNFRNNSSVNFSKLKEIGICTEGKFIRQGKTGAWKNDFSPELNKKADKWIQENLQKTDLRFPQ